MIIFIFNLEVMSWVGAQHVETFTGWHVKQRRNTTPVKTKGSYTSISFGKVGNITVFTHLSDNYHH